MLAEIIEIFNHIGVLVPERFSNVYLGMFEN